MGIIKDWRQLNEVPDATYYTTIGDDRFTTVHWDLKEALSAVSDAFADVAHGDADDCDIELGILVPIARGEDGPEGPTLAHEATSLTTTAHARIVELETEQGELHRELARLRGQLATAREDASEMEKKAIAEGSEALALKAEVAALKAEVAALKAEVAALKAADQWRKMEGAPRDGTEILIWVLGKHCELAVWEGHSCNQWVGDAGRYDEDQVSAWLPIPAPPSGDGQ